MPENNHEIERYRLAEQLLDNFGGDLLSRFTVSDWLKRDAVKMPCFAFSRRTTDEKAQILQLGASLALVSVFCVLFWVLAICTVLCSHYARQPVGNPS